MSTGWSKTFCATWRSSREQGERDAADQALTPRHWELIAALRGFGPSTIADIARRLGRHYKNVHADAQALAKWMVVERGTGI